MSERALATHTCMVTRRSSTITSFVRLSLPSGMPIDMAGQTTHKSAPMVALYWLLNRLLTYWFMSEVLPTLHDTSGHPLLPPAVEERTRCLQE